MALDPKARAQRDEKELATWAPMQRAGQELQREVRRTEALRKQEDGVEATKENKSRGLRAKL